MPKNRRKKTATQEKEEEEIKKMNERTHTHTGGSERETERIRTVKRNDVYTLSRRTRPRRMHAYLYNVSVCVCDVPWMG